MKFKTFGVTAAIILCTSVTSQAGHGYFNEVLRNIGYGFSDGYHAGRYCLPDYHSCSECSPEYLPMMPQPMIIPEPLMAPPEIQQPMTAPEIQQAALPQSVMAPALQPVTRQVPQDSYPIAYPVTRGYRPWYPSYAPGFGQPAALNATYARPR